MATASVGALLGQEDALDWRAAGHRIGSAATAVSYWPGIGQLAALVALIVASAVLGAFVQACAEGCQRLWVGDWPRVMQPLADQLVARRSSRWHDLQARLTARRAQALPDQRSPGTLRALDDLSVRRDRIALAAPTRPTFTGDRLAATATRVRNQYGIDLAACWMRLWLVLPEDARAELRAARARLDAAVTASVWAACYAVLAGFWWPAAVIALVLWLTSWHRGRLAAAGHAELIESVVDLYLRKLATELGTLAPDQPIDPQVGIGVTRIARKGA
ncbi:hypothetical protein [Kitasatospora sp. NBC_01266]|uniref:hypothetical protein n=1 Tax=Kitasatospora sp. NBC_01266 TaxID=2903572 RepID=UPI002E354580|nr:hypothetical protein [Kitasatospora sp. NBC_01266]